MTIRIGDPSHYGDAKIGGATIIDTTNNRNIGDATTPMFARVYASDYLTAMGWSLTTDAANLIFVCDGVDDDETFALAVAALATAKKGIIWMSPGKFKGNNFALSDGITVEGSTGSYGIVTNAATQIILDSNATLMSINAARDACRNILFSGYDPDTSTQYTGALVQFPIGKGLGEFTNCQFYRGVPAEDNDGAFHIRHTNCQFMECGSSTVQQIQITTGNANNVPSDLWYTDCTWESNNGDVFYFDNNGSENPYGIYITNPKFECYGGTGDHVSFITADSNTKVQDLHITGGFLANAGYDGLIACNVDRLTFNGSTVTGGLGPIVAGVIRYSSITNLSGYGYANRNAVTSTLNGDINDVVESLTLNDGTWVNATDFLYIGTEYLYVEAKPSTHVCTVKRGAKGSTAAAHANASSVKRYRWNRTPSWTVLDSGSTYNTIKGNFFSHADPDTTWAATTQMYPGQVVRSSTTGLRYLCTTAGITGSAANPMWAGDVGDYVKDGTCVWQIIGKRYIGICQDDSGQTTNVIEDNIGYGDGVAPTNKVGKVNLLTNGGAELGVYGWVATSGVTLTQDTTVRHSGAGSSFKAVGTAGTYRQFYQTLTDGTKYNNTYLAVGAWLRSADTVTDSTTTLAEDLDASETGVDVADGTKFAVGEYAIIDSEYMWISAINANELTVVRGVNGTAAATHASGAAIYYTTPAFVSLSIKDSAAEINGFKIANDGNWHYCSVESKINAAATYVRVIVDTNWSTSSYKSEVWADDIMCIQGRVSDLPAYNPSPLDPPMGTAMEFVSSSKTLDAGDSGVWQVLTADAQTITLPATATGLRYRIVNGMADGACLVTISPNASDKITGYGLAGADDEDVLNTKATAKFGDYLDILGNGGDGWIVQAGAGIWAEATP